MFILLYNYNKLHQLTKSLSNIRRLQCRKLKWQLFCYHSIEIISEKFQELIPLTLPTHYQLNDADFSRERKLSLPRLITFTLHLTASTKNEGVDIRSGVFFKNARRNGLWSHAEAVHRSAVTKARTKVPWQLFEDIFHQSVALAYECYPERTQYQWHGMSVFAIDGSKCTLPASEELRRQFDPDSGLDNPGKGHYPQCLVSTTYDVFRRIPIARTVTPVDTSEREEALKMLSYIPSNSVLLFDRGYPGYQFIKELIEKYSGYFNIRCPAKNSFPALEKFIASKKEETIIYITPSNKFLQKANLTERLTAQHIKLRAVKLISPDGELSILLTNLFNRKLFPKEAIRALYFKRWGVEDYYRDEKVTLDIEKFHSRNHNGILQELFAAAAMSVISRTLMVLAVYQDDELEPQFKNAIKTLANEIAILVPENPQRVTEIFKELLSEIARVKYYRCKKYRKSQPRVCKKPINKWSLNKKGKMAYA
jgi:hypothetical protein